MALAPLRDTPRSAPIAGASGRNISLANERADDSASDGAGAIWRLPKGVSLLWRSWDDDEVIVFNRASGQTHLLDAFSAAVLRQIEAAPTTVPDLCRHFAIGFALDEGLLHDRLIAICAQFDQLGLAEPEAP